MKNIKEMFYILIAATVLLQSSGTSLLFAKDSESDQSINESVKINEEIVVEETEDDENEIDEEDIEVKLGDFKLTFNDYNKTQSENAYIKTGTSTTGIITFNLDGTDSVAENVLAFRLRFPKDSDVTMPDNTSYELTFGSESDPLGEEVDEQYTYVWFTLKTALGNAQTESINFNHTPDLTPGFLGTDDKVIDIEMQAFKASKNKYVPLDNKANAKIISYGDLFEFNNVYSSFNLTNQSVTTKTDSKLKNIIFNQSVSPKYSSNRSGVVNVKNVIYNNSFNVEANAENNPYINVTSNKQGYVTKFTVITENIANEGQQIGTSAVGFKIVNANLDKELVEKDFNLGVGQSKKVNINNVSSTATAFPIFKVSNLENNEKELIVPKISSTSATYTNASEVGDESDHQNFRKRLVSIANVDTVNSNLENLVAYKNDIVAFDYASTWTNRQEREIERFEITEFADSETGYNSNELLPLRIHTGTASIAGKNLENSKASLDVVVKYKDSTPDFVTTITNLELAKSETINIPIDSQSEVSSISFVYNNMDPNFKIEIAPKI